MTLPASGVIRISNINTEIGNSVNAHLGLSWVQSNTYFSYRNLNSVHGLTWFNAVSSKNSVDRGSTWTTTNCLANCTSQCSNPSGYSGSLTVCNLIANANCNQCGYSHGTYLQANCNCACNCYVCNCSYNNCNCNCYCSSDGGACSADGGIGDACGDSGDSGDTGGDAAGGGGDGGDGGGDGGGE